MPSCPAPPDPALFKKLGFRPPPTTLVPEPGFDASTIWVPFTAGGDKLVIERIAPLEAHHYEQGDKRYNRLIWDLYPPIMALTIEGKWEKDKPRLDAMLGSSKVPYDIDKLKTCIPAYEPARIDDNLYTLSVIIFYSDHEVSGQRFENVGAWAARKRANTMDPLAIAVRDAKAKKDEINKTFWKEGKWFLALNGYAKALVGLYPWTATPLLFTPDKAFASGLAQVEGALWSNMAIACLKLASADGDPQYYDLAMRCAEAVTHMRYTTHKLLGQCYQRLSLARGALYSVPDPMVHLQAGLDMNQALNSTEFKLQGAGAAAMVKHRELEKEGKKDVWAHATCYNDHMPCSLMGDLFEALKNNAKPAN